MEWTSPWRTEEDGGTGLVGGAVGNLGEVRNEGPGLKFGRLPPLRPPVDGNVGGVGLE